jgi:RNA polymerase sigma factor (TIGR02999 family)
VIVQPELVTEVLLSHWRVGDEQARDGLISRLYPELAQIAAARLRSERNSSLSTGDLLNDAVMRLMQREAFSIADRAHFLALASRMMRHILIDHARAKGSAKRRHVRVEISSRIDGEQRFDLIALEVALVRLGAIDHRLMELVEMRYFGGMSVSDVAVVTGWSEPTVKRRWQTARAWLTDALMNPVRDN